MALRLHLATLKDNDDRLVGVQAIVDDMTSAFQVATEFIHVLDPNGAVLQTKRLRVC